MKRISLRTAFMAFLTAILSVLSGAQTPRVLFLGGCHLVGCAGATHNADSMGIVMMPVMRSYSSSCSPTCMTVDYKTNETILNTDSLKRYDVMFIYNSKKGTSVGTASGDYSPDLTTAQLNALYAWVDSGHVIVGVHCANSSYLSNPTYLQLFGAAFKDHGSMIVPKITIVKPTHPAMVGVSAPPNVSDSATTYWDEDRTGTFYTPSDTILLSVADSLSTANSPKEPWTWVRPQGKGWVYYTSSAHDNRSWQDPNLQKQLIQALLWGYSVSQSATGIYTNHWGTGGLFGKTSILQGPHLMRIFNVSGETVLFKNLSAGEAPSLSGLPAGAYHVDVSGTH